MVRLYPSLFVTVGRGLSVCCTAGLIICCCWQRMAA